MRLYSPMSNFLAPIHPDGWKFVALFSLATILLFSLAQPLGWIGLVYLFLSRPVAGDAAARRVDGQSSRWPRALGRTGIAAGRARNGLDDDDENRHFS